MFPGRELLCRRCSFDSFTNPLSWRKTLTLTKRLHPMAVHVHAMCLLCARGVRLEPREDVIRLKHIRSLSASGCLQVFPIPGSPKSASRQHSHGHVQILVKVET
eukprot:3548469-Rhodomonas_salina.1